MDYRKIEELLKKYWNAETSIEEEKELKMYFRNNEADLPNHLKEVANLFLYYDREKAGRTDRSFDRGLFSHLDDYTSYKINNSRNFSKSFLKIAAAIVFVILISIGVQQLIVNNNPEKTVVASTYEDPEKAFEETKRALLFISAKLNEGKEHAAEGLATINKVNKQVKNIN